MNRQLRIITNGKFFRVEEKVIKGWFKKREVWKVWEKCYGNHLGPASRPINYYSRIEAEEAIKEALSDRSWRVVK